MSFVGTFGSFTTARLGIYASQKGLSVTGNNIANINTRGYTRQALDQISLRAGGNDRYQSQWDCRVGNGVMPIGVSQIRDPYLDIRYRTEMASVGAADEKLSGLGDLAHILDEVAKGEGQDGVIEAQLSDLLDKLQHLDVFTGQKEYDTQVRESASALVTLFKSYANRLSELEKNAEINFGKDVDTVNQILTNIRDLNESIRKSEIHGDSALELRDERNNLIDELSSYMKIDVIYTMEDVGAGQMVEKLTIKLANANPDPTKTTDSSTLVDGIYATQLKIRDEIPKINPKYDPNDPANNFKYLDAAGKPTNSLDQAEMVPNDNYDLQLAELRDSEERLFKAIKTLEEKVGDTDQDYVDFVNNGQKPIVTTDANTGITTTVTYEKRPGPNNTTDVIKITTTSTPSKPINLDDNDLYGSLQSAREMLTEVGEFASAGTINGVDHNAATKRGIPYYRKTLDLLANKIATEFNKANQGVMVDENGNYIDDQGKPLTFPRDPALGDPFVLSKDMELNDNQSTALFYEVFPGATTNADGFFIDNKGEPILLNGEPVKPGQLPEEQKAALLETYVNDTDLSGAQKAPNSGPLFSNRGDGNETDGITAANISIAIDWANGKTHVVPTYVKPSDEMNNSTANENILHLVALMDKKLDYNPSDVAPDAKNQGSMFKGSFQEMLVNMQSVLGNDQRKTTIMLETYSNAAVQLDTSRDAISGVDLNDEAANLMQYSKSYSAACRLMTTLDEVLDKLINGTGTVGR